MDFKIGMLIKLKSYKQITEETNNGFINIDEWGKVHEINKINSNSIQLKGSIYSFNESMVEKIIKAKKTEDLLKDWK